MHNSHIIYCKCYLNLGKKWLFQCGRWLAKNEDDGLLERELYPQEDNTEEYVPCKYGRS